MTTASIEHPPLGRRFWLIWMIASTIGSVMGMTAYQTLNSAFIFTPLYIIALLAPGAVVGVAQWLVLRQRVPRAGWWILATLGIGMGLAVAEAGPVWVYLGVVVVSPFQWRVLRRHVARAGWWIPASLLGSIAGYFASLVVSLAAMSLIGGFEGAATENSGVTIQGGTSAATALAWSEFIWAGIGTAVNHAITGAALIWLLRHPAPAKS